MLGLSLGASGQSTPAAPPGSVKANCTDLKAKSKAECEKVATKMEQSPVSGETPGATASKPDPSYENHSSPIMQTREEKVVDKAVKSGKDPAPAIAKLKAEDAARAADKEKPNERPPQKR